MALQEEVFGFFIPSVTLMGVGSHKEIGDQIKALGSKKPFICTDQAIVEAGNWFAASINDTASYSLVGCTVAPGFDFADFTMADRGHLMKLFPDHRDLIKKFTHG